MARTESTAFRTFRPDGLPLMALTTMMYRGFSDARAIARASSDLSSLRSISYSGT